MMIADRVCDRTGRQVSKRNDDGAPDQYIVFRARFLPQCKTLKQRKSLYVCPHIDPLTDSQKRPYCL